MAIQPQGIIAAMITPLNADYSINRKALGSYIGYLIAGGIHGLFINGTSGEFYGLTESEREILIDISIESVADRIPIYYGISDITTDAALRHIEQVQDRDIAAFSVLTPMFTKLTQDELIRHYTELAENSGKPILIYNNPAKTGNHITVDSVEVLSALDRIVGIKDSSGDFTNMCELIRRTAKSGFNVLSGRDTLIFPCLQMGGRGSIAACGNIAPILCAGIFDEFERGNIDRARALQLKLNPLRVKFGLGTFPVVIKECLQMIGIEAGPCFPPINNLNEEKRAELRPILEALRQEDLIRSP